MKSGYKVDISWGKVLKPWVRSALCLE